MKIILTIVFINFILISSNESSKKNSTSDSFGEDDTIDNIIEDLSEDLNKIFSEIKDQIENVFDDLVIENEIIIDEELNNINFESDEEFINKLKQGLGDSEEEEKSIWPERPVPKYKNIV